jgi:N-acetyl-anhydromuramyl-L-alanine amidase AmpD
MYKRDWVYKTRYVWRGTNTHEYIILHHTGWIWDWNLRILQGLTPKQVSVHFYVDQKGQAFKLAEPDQITYHAGESKRWDLVNMNQYSLWIEIEWPWFTDKQYEKVCDLVKYLRTAFNIPLENILKHSDITSLCGLSEKKQLRDWKSKTRKVDLAPEFWQNRKFNNYEDFRNKCL